MVGWMVSLHSRIPASSQAHQMAYCFLQATKRTWARVLGNAERHMINELVDILRLHFPDVHILSPMYDGLLIIVSEGCYYSFTELQVCMYMCERNVLTGSSHFLQALWTAKSLAKYQYASVITEDVGLREYLPQYYDI